MDRDGAERPVAPLARAMLILGDQWNLLILQQAFLHRVRRFSEWHERLGLAESVLSDRLSELVDAQILATAPYRSEDGRQREEYHLTERGLDLWSLLVSLWAWERTWVLDQQTGPWMEHEPCGRLTVPVLACNACGVRPITAHDTQTLVVVTGAIAAGSRLRHHRRSSRGPAENAHLAYHQDTLAILGDRWSTLTLGAALLGTRTFAGFRTRLGIGPTTLSDRLRTFVDYGILRIEATADRRSHEYRLTHKGLAFFPVFAVLTQWADTWLGDEGAARSLDIVHTSCGAPFVPRLVCEHCAGPITRTDVRFHEFAPTPARAR